MGVGWLWAYVDGNLLHGGTPGNDHIHVSWVCRGGYPRQDVIEAHASELLDSVCNLQRRSVVHQRVGVRLRRLCECIICGWGLRGLFFLCLQ